MEPGKTLRVPEGSARMTSISREGGHIEWSPAHPEEARRLIEAALMVGADVDTFGEVHFERITKRFNDWQRRLFEKSQTSRCDGMETNDFERDRQFAQNR